MYEIKLVFNQGVVEYLLVSAAVKDSRSRGGLGVVSSYLIFSKCSHKSLKVLNRSSCLDFDPESLSISTFYLKSSNTAAYSSRE